MSTNAHGGCPRRTHCVACAFFFSDRIQDNCEMRSRQPKRSPRRSGLSRRKTREQYRGTINDSILVSHMSFPVQYTNDAFVPRKIVSKINHVHIHNRVPRFHVRDGKLWVFFPGAEEDFLDDMRDSQVVHAPVAGPRRSRDWRFPPAQDGIRRVMANTRIERLGHGVEKVSDDSGEFELRREFEFTNMVEFKTVFQDTLQKFADHLRDATLYNHDEPIILRLHKDTAVMSFTNDTLAPSAHSDLFDSVVRALDFESESEQHVDPKLLDHDSVP